MEQKGLVSRVKESMVVFFSVIFQYKRRGDPVEEDEFTRTCTDCTFKRTMRDKSQVLDDQHTIKWHFT